MSARDLPPDFGRRPAVPVLRVLLFAPATSLLLAAAEVAAVANTAGLFVRQMQGEVTRAEATRRVLQGRERWDVLWFATHGTRDGILFSDGLLTPAGLIPLVRASGAYLIVLNTCDSATVGEELASVVGVDVIATVVSVPDDVAFTTGAYLAHWLAETGDPRRAYDRSRPGGDGSIYRYFASLSTWQVNAGGYRDMPAPEEKQREPVYSQRDPLSARTSILEGDVRVLNTKIENIKTSITMLTITLAIMAIAVIVLFVIGGAT